MDLRQVAAVGAESLPDIRNRVKTDDINTVVAEIQHICRHIIKDDRVAVIQVPLIRVEAGHNDFLSFLAPCEVARCCRRKYLRDSLLELVRNCPVIIEEISLLILDLALACSDSPLVIFTCVVHDKVKAYAHAHLVAVKCELIQILHCAEFRLDLAEIRYRVAAVAAVLRALKERHKVYIVDTALLDVIKVLMNTLKVAGEAVRVEEHSEKIISLIPVRDEASGVIPLLQYIRSLLIVLIHHL